MKILSLIILAIYMCFFWINVFDGKTRAETLGSLILFIATSVPFFYIANG